MNYPVEKQLFNRFFLVFPMNYKDRKTGITNINISIENVNIDINENEV